MITDQWYSFSTQKMYNRDTINGIDVYVLTVYFVDPSTICSEGRDAAQLKTASTGSGLWLQNGTNPIIDSIQAPLYENAVGSTNWIKGGCYPSMGKETSVDLRKRLFYTSAFLIQVFIIGTTIDWIRIVTNFSQFFYCITEAS